ncbi:MAG: hypothetical protein GY782_04590 [Gammaproteobacteria bacterium]|nr:hypothetical protein [Gammaproteobacteria bacterium]
MDSKLTPIKSFHCFFENWNYLYFEGFYDILKHFEKLIHKSCISSKQQIREIKWQQNNSSAKTANINGFTVWLKI